MLTSTLAAYQAHVLDVGEAVIHDELNLGMMISIARADAAALRVDLESVARAQGAVVRFTSIAANDYGDWVGQQGKPRYIVTLLARGISAQQLAAVVTTVERHGLSVDGIRRLSGRPALDQITPTRASIELSLRGVLTEPMRLRAQLLDTSTQLAFDFSLQQDTVYRRNRRLVAFDMDSTLIEAEVIDELAKVKGVGAKVSAITAQAMAGEIDFKESFRRRVKLLAGLPVAVLTDVAKRVPLMEGADRLIGALRHFGYRTAVISGGFTVVGERLQRELHIDYVYANALEVDGGVVTGKVQGEIIDAQRKASLLKEICRKEGIALAQCIAIGDGANDLPMLGAAGLGVAFHPKPVVRESASHAISNFGLDAVLYLMGFSDRDIAETEI
jgi:phosphoserine phosphatase